MNLNIDDRLKKLMSKDQVGLVIKEFDLIVMI